MHIDSHIDYRPSGGFEIFHSTDAHFEEHFSRIEFWNNRLKSIVGPAVFSVRSATEFSSSNIREKLIFNEYEGLLHPGKLISSLFEKARMAEIQFFFGMEVLSIDKDTADIKIYGKEFALSSGQVLLATNAFTTALLPDIKVSPARNQVLVTSEIDDLQLVGGYHLDRGYFYFRRIGDRILIGGGRQLDSKAETTSSFGTSELIMGRLEQMLREDIIPGKDFNIDYRWSGILGIGAQKSALVERINDRLSIGVRLGGMGVAIGSLVGRELAELCS